MLKVAILVSGGGSNLQAIIDAKMAGEIPNGELCAVISSNQDAYALTRASNAGIPGYVVDRKAYDSREAFTDAILEMLARCV